MQHFGTRPQHLNDAPHPKRNSFQNQTAKKNNILTLPERKLKFWSAFPSESLFFWGVLCFGWFERKEVQAVTTVVALSQHHRRLTALCHTLVDMFLPAPPGGACCLMVTMTMMRFSSMTCAGDILSETMTCRPSKATRMKNLMRRLTQQLNEDA